MTGPHRTSITPRWYELDPYRHVNHSVYVQYFEVARVELLDEIGFGIDVLAESGMNIVVTEIRTSFLASATLNDQLVVETEMAELRRASTVWNQRILRSDDLIASQEVTAAVLGPTGRPMRIDAELRSAMTQFS